MSDDTKEFIIAEYYSEQHKLLKRSEHHLESGVWSTLQEDDQVILGLGIIPPMAAYIIFYNENTGEKFDVSC